MTIHRATGLVLVVLKTLHPYDHQNLSKSLHRHSDSLLLLLTCPDDHSLHQLSGVEACLDDLSATEQRVSLVLLRAVAGLRLEARRGQAGLGDRDALPWETSTRLLSDGVRVVEESERRRNLTGEHALIHDAGSLDEHGIAGHDGPVGRDDDDVTGHEVRGHGLVDVWGGGVTRRERFDIRGDQ